MRFYFPSDSEAKLAHGPDDESKEEEENDDDDRTKKQAVIRSLDCVK